MISIGNGWREERAVLLAAVCALIGSSEALAKGRDVRKARDEVCDGVGQVLKGLSHKEIARARESSERTIRQQAQSIYGKANLSGRAALSAFFLEDLLLPREQSG